MKQFLLAGLLLMSSLAGSSRAFAQTSIPDLKPLVASKLTPSAAPGTDPNKVTAAKLREVFNALIDQLALLEAGRDANATQNAANTLAIVARPDLISVDTFEAAKALVRTGKPRLFVITTDERYGLSLTYWTGTQFYVSPLILRNK